MDQIREKIKEAITRNNANMRQLSLQLGRNQTYMQQFLKRHVPQELPVKLLPKVAALLDIPIEELVDLELLNINSKTDTPLLSSGFAEDAEAYQPDAGQAIYNTALSDANLAPFTIKSMVLDAIGIKAGDVLIFNMSAIAVKNIQSGNVVVCQAFNDDNKTTSTIIRQFLPPSKLVANSTIREYITIDTTKQDVHIRGVLITNNQN